MRLRAAGASAGRPSRVVLTSTVRYCRSVGARQLRSECVHESAVGERRKGHGGGGSGLVTRTGSLALHVIVALLHQCTRAAAMKVLSYTREILQDHGPSCVRRRAEQAEDHRRVHACHRGALALVRRARRLGAKSSGKRACKQHCARYAPVVCTTAGALLYDRFTAVPCRVKCTLCGTRRCDR